MTHGSDEVPDLPLIEVIAAEIAAMTPGDRQRVNDVVAGICGTLGKLADDQVMKKSSVETRWIEDLRQYHGKYDPKTEKELADAKQSKVFANLTRPKTNAWAARIGDILFPTDDKNWALGPTPVPELSTKLSKSRFEARRLTKRATLYSMLAKTAADEEYRKTMRGRAEQTAHQALPHAQAALEAQNILDEAQSRAEAMETEIEDQLTEAKYGEKARIGIRDMCKLGTVIMKGPLTKTRVRGSWKYEEGEWRLDMIMDPRPDAQRVDPWDFFPDMNARTIDEAEFFFERHLMTKRELRKLARKPGFDRDAIRELLKGGSTTVAPTFLQNMREITGNQNVSLENRYTVWEYHGPLEGHEIDSIARAMLPPEDAAAMIAGIGDDPLREQPVVLWFCDGRPLKLAPHPLDSGEHIYSASCFVDDPTSIFGFGVPYLARNAQAIINAAWRLMMDNADMSVGPQVAINSNVIEPADRDWNLRGFKLWLYQQGKTLPPGSVEPFQVFQTNSNLQYLLEVIKLAMAFLDEEISLPLVAQGEQGAHVETAEGRGMLMNAANVIFRDAVRSWDDRITVPMLTRAFDWNMQHSDKEHIKGDMEIKARGSSVLLVRDMQSQNLSNFLTAFGASPIYGPFVKHVDGLRELSKTMMLDSAKLVKTDDEIEAELAEQSAQQKPPTPEEIKLLIAKEEGAIKLKIAQAERETKMMDLAMRSNTTLEKINADLTKFREKVAHEERLTAVDAALTQRQMAVKTAPPHPNVATTGTEQ